MDCPVLCDRVALSARPLFPSANDRCLESATGELIVTEPVARPSAVNECMLLRELNHRISNEFTSAIYLISVEAVRSENVAVKHALNDVVELLHQYADVHQALKVPDQETLADAAGYLQKLCLSLARSRLNRLDIHLVFAADPLLLQSDRRWRLGLIVNELLTNVARHARFEGGAGEVRVELKDVGTFVSCKVSDNGCAPEVVCSGRGLTTVGKLAESLGGRIRLSSANGSSFMLAFPLTQHEQQANCSINRVASLAARLMSHRVPGRHTYPYGVDGAENAREGISEHSAASPKK
jgi:two-component sensor histidine kinase